MMKNPLIDDSLIISRLEQKELSYIKPSMKEDSQFYLLMGKTTIKPFIDNLPINIGLNLQLLGDKIIGSQVDDGYFFHDLENSLSQVSATDGVFLLERIAKNPIFYQIALMLAHEEILGLTPDQETSKRYAIALEFARVAHHLMVLINVFSSLRAYKLLGMAQNIERVLAKPIKLCTKVVKDSLKSALSLHTVDNLLNEALNLFHEFNSSFLEEDLLLPLKKKAFISLSVASSLGLTGLYTRANRSIYDLRKTSILPYETLIPTTEGGDAWGRLQLRLMDIQASLKGLKKTITTMEQSDMNFIALHKDFFGSEPMHKMAVGEVSGPEGDIRVSIFTSSKPEDPLLFRIRSPAYFIASAIPSIIFGLKIHELSPILHSLGITAEEIDL